MGVEEDGSILIAIIIGSSIIAIYYVYSIWMDYKCPERVKYRYRIAREKKQKEIRKDRINQLTKAWNNNKILEKYRSDIKRAREEIDKIQTDEQWAQLMGGLGWKPEEEPGNYSLREAIKKLK